MVSTPLPVTQVFGGNPYRDDYQPTKEDIIRYLKALEAAIEGGDLTGLAAKSYIVAFNVQNVNTLHASTDIPVPAQDGGALIALPIVADNTASPVTVSFNGGAALTIKTSAGNDVSVGGLTAGMIVAGYKSGDTFRLLTDQVSEAIAARAEAAAAAAQAAAASLAGSMPSAPDRTALKGYDFTKFPSAYLLDGSGKGVFSYVEGDFTDEVAADPAGGVFIVPNGKVPAEAVLRREYDDGVSARWFTDGIDGDYAIAVNRAIAVATQRGERMVSIPPGPHDIKTSILMSEAGLRLRGYGRGSGGSSASSVYKKGVTGLNWIGGTNDDMIALNEGSTAIRWGMQVDNMVLYANGIAGINGINGNGYTANAVFRHLDVVGAVNGYTCDAGAPGTAYCQTFFDVCMYHFTGYGFNLPGKNHNSRIHCSRAWSDSLTPSGAVFIGGGATGVSIVGNDFEAGYAPFFLVIRQASGIHIAGNYFEARSTSTQQFIRLGENTDGSAGVFGAEIVGNVFHGHDFAAYVLMLQSHSSGINYSGNEAYGLVTAWCNNNLPGNNNSYGPNSLTSTPLLFSGSDDGWRKSTRSRLSADSAAITTDTGLLETNHYARSPAAARTIRAVLYTQSTDTATSSVNTRYQFQVSTDGGTTWADYGAVARGGVGSISGGPLYETIVLEEQAVNALSAYASIRYRVSVKPGTTDSIVVLQGSSLTVREEDY